MAKSGIHIVNMSEVLKDFRNYDRKTKKAFRITMHRTSLQVKANQVRALVYKVKEWTGTLATSIKIKKRKWWHIEIGPTTKTAYYRFIEEGGHPYGNPNANFNGYWYVRNSIRGVQADLKKRLQRDIENATRK